MTDFLDQFFSADKPRRRPKLARRTIRTDYYSTRTFERTADVVKPLDDAREELCQTVPTGMGMTEDLFHLLHKVEPEDEKAEEIDPDYLRNAVVRDVMHGMKELEELRQLGTVGNPENAALGVASLMPDVAAAFDRLTAEEQQMKELQELIEQLLQAQGETDEIEAEPDDSDEDEDGGSGSGGKRARLQASQDKADGLQEQIEQAKTNVRRGLQAKVGAVRQQVAQGVNKALDQAKDLNALEESWGIDPGEIKRLDPAERIALAKRIKDRPKLRRLAQLIGKFSRVALAEQRKKVTYARTEVVGIEQGDNLDQVVPAELARMRHPKLRKGFIRDFAEHKLVQYRLQGTERAGLGSIICCFDGSGSMEGDPEIFAKAVCVALLNMAKAQHREFQAIQFGSSYELEEWSFTSPGDFTADKILAMCEYFFDGGTDFQAPLSLALSHLQEEHLRAGNIKGDIVFITDGYCSVTDVWLAQFKAEQERLGFQVFGVLIGVDQTREPLHTICDGRVVTIQNLLAPEDMRGVFQAIHSP